MVFKKMTVASDLLLWLDATDNNTIEKHSEGVVQNWTSRDVTGRKLTAAFTDVYPMFHPKDNNSPASIEFDFLRTMTIDRPLTDIKTVISVHKYKDTVSSFAKDKGYEYFFLTYCSISIF